MKKHNPYAFQPVPTQERIAELNELKPKELLDRIKRLEKEVKLLKSQRSK